MDETVFSDPQLLGKMEAIAHEGIKSAAYGISQMAGRHIEVGQTAIRIAPLLEIPRIVGGPDEDAVGIYLRFNGDLIGQIMLVIPCGKVNGLVDMLMDVPQGTTQEIGKLEKSALGELGNLCGSFFLNSLAKAVDASFRPSPPAVMVDMVGAIMQIIVATSGASSEQVILVQANLLDETNTVDVAFCATPDMSTLQTLINKNSGV
jgi:chemotaxis protein CheC